MYSSNSPSSSENEYHAMLKRLVNAPSASLNLPSVDYSTFTPLYGARFYSCDISNVDFAVSSINESFSSEFSQYDIAFDQSRIIWTIQERNRHETATYAIHLVTNSAHNKLYVKFHRIQGSSEVFYKAVGRFTDFPSVREIFMLVCPRDQSESAIVKSLKSSTLSLHPPPVPAPQHTPRVTMAQFKRYLDSIICWAKDSPTDALSTLLCTMPTILSDIKQLTSAAATANDKSVVFEQLRLLMMVLGSIVTQSFDHLSVHVLPHPLPLVSVLNSMKATTTTEFSDHHDIYISAHDTDATLHALAFEQHSFTSCIDPIVSVCRSMSLATYQEVEQPVFSMGCMDKAPVVQHRSEEWDTVELYDTHSGGDKIQQETAEHFSEHCVLSEYLSDEEFGALLLMSLSCMSSLLQELPPSCAPRGCGKKSEVQYALIALAGYLKLHGLHKSNADNCYKRNANFHIKGSPYFFESPSDPCFYFDREMCSLAENLLQV